MSSIIPNVCLIAAVAKDGGIGLAGDLPWPRHLGDLPWFREQTMGHHVVIGMRTYRAMCERMAPRAEETAVQLDMLGDGTPVVSPRLPIGDDGPIPGRMVHLWNGQDPEPFLADIIDGEYGHRRIFIAGGAHTYRTFAPFVSKWLVTRVDYSGPFDTAWPFTAPWPDL